MTARAKFKKETSPDKWKTKFQQLQRQFDAYVEDRGTLQEHIETMAAHIQTLEPPKLDYQVPKPVKGQTPIVAVTHWTDWHYGCVQMKEEIEGGFGRAFDSKILTNRMHNCVSDELAWVEHQRQIYNIKDNHILVTGDIVNGELHYDDIRSNDEVVPVQSIDAGRLLGELVARKAPHFEKIVVEFLVADNHGRLMKKPQAKEAGYNHWGYVVGNYAKTWLKEFKNVTFNVYPWIKQVVEVNGRKYLLIHGDRIKGWAGFPYYGIAREVAREAIKRMKRANKKASLEEAQTLKEILALHFDKIIMGHWHAPLKHPDYWIGGSAQGTSSYDHSEGRESDPIQCSWLVHPRHGEFNTIDWDLRDDPPR